MSHCSNKREDIKGFEGFEECWSYLGFESLRVCFQFTGLNPGLIGLDQLLGSGHVVRPCPSESAEFREKGAFLATVLATA